MKKVLLALLLIILPINVFAAGAYPTITTLELSNDKGTIKYSGEVDDSNTGGVTAYAVMCKLFNSKDEEIDLLSTEVADHKFEGSFIVTVNDTYKISCANYEGGDFKSDTIKVSDVKNPKTGDNMYIYCVVFAVCIAAVVIAAMYPRFLKKVKAKRATKKTSKK